MTDMLYTPKHEIDTRIQALQTTLDQRGMDGALIVHHTNLFYLTGTSQSGHLFVPRSGAPLLMIRKSYDRARRESPIEDIREVKSLKMIPALLKEKNYTINSLGMELDVIPYTTWQFYSQVFADSELIDISDSIKKNRMIKSQHEIFLLQGACAILDQVFAEVPAMLREGMTEVELASLFEAAMRRRGYAGCSKMRAFNQDFFLGNITSGSSGAVSSYFDGPVGGSGLTPANNPHGAGWKPIGRNEVIYIDYTCLINGYTADGARMFVIGDVSERLRQAHAVALDIQADLTAMLKPGTACEDIYARAVELAEQTGFGDHFMGIGKDRVRFIGHGVGLELDEYPIFAKGVKMELTPGMTFALEPKFVFPEGAIGIENTYVLDNDSARVLTHAPEEIIRV
ncbi:M24 family metallopeptidase [Desulfobulbus alkaliphilus]|uniref:M24 family metallopeptidase n=1 Tax=Desulfobulbus alkaliphilus TaxID=869814 RepID=UPI0019665B9F|nr:Xaa-Pro peptidase family protein [Desulfobulbus alkaliphilus]MBM9537041.1 aminopeptidase P family protein [Desulfobulbus alkaliphilus]